MSIYPRKDGKGITIDFYYCGVRCRETVKLSPTKLNLRYGSNLHATILHEIATNTFEFRKHFPHSKTKASRIFGNAAAGNMTIEDSLINYLEVNQIRWKTSTKKTNHQAVHSHLIPAFRDTRLVDINVVIIKEYISRLTCGNKRINNILIPLRGMLKEAFMDGMIEQNPMDRVQNLPIQTREPKPFTPDEKNKILHALPGQAANFFNFAFHTGLRTGELIALSWNDIDWDNSIVRVSKSFTCGEETTTKTMKSVRGVVLFEPALHALKAQKPFTFEKAKRIFHNPRTNKPWIDDGQIRKRYWVPALKKAGVEYREPYQTRHTYASSMLSVGEHPVWISKQLGHSNTNMMFQRYARWVPEMFPQAGDKIRQLWSQNGQ